MKNRILTSMISGLLAAGSLCTVARGAENTPTSELLEKGIYAEETKGDIDAAITLYQQLLNEAKANQRVAAQAQFRLAQCLLKKNRAAEATAAFERLISE